MRAVASHAHHHNQPPNSDQALRAKIWGHMPARMKVLYVTTLHRTGGWLAEGLRRRQRREIPLEEAIGVTAGLAQLRDEVFDAVLVSHEPDVLDGARIRRRAPRRRHTTSR